MTKQQPRKMPVGIRFNHFRKYEKHLNRLIRNARHLTDIFFVEREEADGQFSFHDGSLRIDVMA